MPTTDFSSSGGQIIVTVGSNDPINYSPSGSSYGFLPNYPNRLQVIFISANIPVSYIVELADLRVSGSGSAPADEAAALTALDAVWADAAGGGGSGWTPLTTRTITSAQTLTTTDGLILCNAANNNIVDLQLPDAAAWYAANGVTPLTIMRIDDQAGTWSVNFDSQANGATIPNLTSQYSFFSFESDGSLWKIIGQSSSQPTAYIDYITQSSTNAPVGLTTPFENTFSGSWSYQGAGYYRWTFTTPVADATKIFIPYKTGAGITSIDTKFYYKVVEITTTYVDYVFYDNAINNINDLLEDITFPIEIHNYNL